jgi:hypothetical protein
MVMVVEDAHKQMFNPNLGGVVRTLKLGKDFGTLHQIVQCITWIPTLYPCMMFVPIWNGVVFS